ncbi:MAG: hypothetical protein COB37_03605 [Kordiimonadales bacterium]|nr:MAG: hypothetical protein COB37_03605 [Kordiimonadales bacterium]
MKHLLTVLFIFFVSAWAPASATDGLPGAEEYVRGDYYKARTIARTANTSDGYANACQSGLVIGGFLETGDEAVAALHGAISDCIKALELAPNHYLAKLSLSVALSFEGKRLKKIIYPKHAKALIEQLMQQENKNPIGFGAMGAWHSEISAAGFFARLLLGARRKNAEFFYVRALELGVDDYALKLEHVKFLARGKKAERKQATKLAGELLALPTDNAFDDMLKGRCRLLLDAIRVGKKRFIKQTLIDISAFKSIASFRKLKAYPLNKVNILTLLKS